MKKIHLALICLLCVILCMAGCASSRNAGSEEVKTLSAREMKSKYSIKTTARDTKVIIDGDFQTLNDDTYALFTLLKADELGFLDLLGITTVGGNTLIAGAAYDVLNQLERVDRADVPVYLGYDIPLTGFKDQDKLQNTIGKMGYLGAYRFIDQYTTDYKKAKELGISVSPLPDPVTEPRTDMDAVDFMISQVHKYPGKVWILSLGAPTNVAKAVMKDPTFAQDAAGIFYMGGVYEASGEELKNIEINFWYDPDATNICLAAPWKAQRIISHDAATTCTKGADSYRMFKEKQGTEINKYIVESLAPIYENGKEEALLFCWDPMVPACLLCPDLIETVKEKYIWVDTREGKTYANIFSWDAAQAPADVYGPCEVILKVNRDRFWEFTSDMYNSSAKPQ